MLDAAKCFACVVTLNITKNPMKKTSHPPQHVVIVTPILLVKKWSTREAGSLSRTTQLARRCRGSNLNAALFDTGAGMRALYVLCGPM